LPNDGFLYESTNRQQDGSVIHSIATFGEYLYPPESEVSECNEIIRGLQVPKAPDWE